MDDNSAMNRTFAYLCLYVSSGCTAGVYNSCKFWGKTIDILRVCMMEWVDGKRQK